MGWTPDLPSAHNSTTRYAAMATDLTVMLEDKAGTLARVGEAMGDAGINIDGVCGFDTGPRDEVHILIADADAAREALSAASIKVGRERDVEVISMVDVPGEMGRHLRRIADAGVNLEVVYLASNTRLVLGSDDQEGLRRALHGH
jgi:hypothetical protein